MNSGGIWYAQSITATKTAFLPLVPIAGWDIENTGVAWKFIVSEYDPSQSVTNSYTNSSSFATNFSIEPGTGLLKKIGLKFGITATTTSSQTYSVTTQYDSDQLGEAALYFYDKVVTDLTPIFPPGAFKGNTYDINTGWVKLSIEPYKIY